jgi:hypothetical protein
MAVHQHARPVPNDMERHHVEVSRGLGNPVSPKGVAEEGYPTGPPSSQPAGDGRRAPLSSRCIAFCVALPILPHVHQNLELFKRHGFLCRRFLSS